MEIYFSSLTISSRLLLQDCFLSNDPTMHQRYVFSSSKVRPKKTVNRERERKKRELWIHRRRLIFPGRHPERNLFSLRIFGEEEFSSDSVTYSTLCEGMNNCVSGSDFYFYRFTFFKFFFLLFFCKKSRENISGMFFWVRRVKFRNFCGSVSFLGINGKNLVARLGSNVRKRKFFFKALWSFEKIFWEN